VPLFRIIIQESAVFRLLTCVKVDGEQCTLLKSYAISSCAISTDIWTQVCVLFASAFVAAVFELPQSECFITWWKS